MIKVEVLLLDKTTYCVLQDPNANGSTLFAAVLLKLRLSKENSQYFGLQFQPKDNIIQWVHPDRPFNSQWKNLTDKPLLKVPVKFRVKFYEKNPDILSDDLTRHLFYLQIRHDIYRGKLPCSINVACLLASFVAQAELGDYISIDHRPGYLSCLQLLRGQNEDLERRVSELHKLHRGQLPNDAKMNYLEHAKHLDMYGVDLHKVTVCSGENWQLGVTLTGVLIYKNGIKLQALPFSKIHCTCFNERYFEMKVRSQSLPSCVKNIKFKMPSLEHARALWKSCADHYLFTKGAKNIECPENRLLKAIGKRRSSKFRRVGNENDRVKNQKPNELQKKVKQNPEDAVFKKSMIMLCKSLDTGDLAKQYDKLLRTNPKHAFTVSQKPINRKKNRYSNILPYDPTRVVLQNCESGDYINANFVNVQIYDEECNCYIATQGPLANTVVDFWRMVQQENCHLIVMLSTVKELGVQKCYQYWPNLGIKQYLSSGFWIKCITEQPDKTGSYVLREITLFDDKVKGNRTVQHIQYLAWPDHGVPSDPRPFLLLTKRIQDIRISTRVHQFISRADPPTIVHCSAGIGRTGVFILLDASLAKIAAGKSINPIAMLTEMRDQRPGLIQHYNQFRFVCEAICEVYASKL